MKGVYTFKDMEEDIGLAIAPWFRAIAEALMDELGAVRGKPYSKAEMELFREKVAAIARNIYDEQLEAKRKKANSGT